MNEEGSSLSVGECAGQSAGPIAGRAAGSTVKTVTMTATMTAEYSVEHYGVDFTEHTEVTQYSADLCFDQALCDEQEKNMINMIRFCMLSDRVRPEYQEVHCPQSLKARCLKSLEESEA